MLKVAKKRTLKNAEKIQYPNIFVNFKFQNKTKCGILCLPHQEVSAGFYRNDLENGCGYYLVN
jgi:hypothetical protein